MPLFFVMNYVCCWLLVVGCGCYCWCCCCSCCSCCCCCCTCCCFLLYFLLYFCLLPNLPAKQICQPKVFLKNIKHTPLPKLKPLRSCHVVFRFSKVTVNLRISAWRFPWNPWNPGLWENLDAQMMGLFQGALHTLPKVGIFKIYKVGIPISAGPKS